jgi:hypothetical protein
VLHKVVHEAIGSGATAAKHRSGCPRRPPSYLVRRLITSFFQIRAPRELALGGGPCAPIRVRLGVLPKWRRNAVRPGSAHWRKPNSGWRRYLECHAYSQFPPSDPRSKLESRRHARPSYDPGSRPRREGGQEGRYGPPNRDGTCRSAPHNILGSLPARAAPQTDAIGKLADVADRRLALLQQAATFHQPVAIHQPVSEQGDRPIVRARRDPPAALPEQPDVGPPARSARSRTNTSRFVKMAALPRHHQHGSLSQSAFSTLAGNSNYHSAVQDSCSNSWPSVALPRARSGRDVASFA